MIILYSSRVLRTLTNKQSGPGRSAGTLARASEIDAEHHLEKCEQFRQPRDVKLFQSPDDTEQVCSRVHINPVWSEVQRRPVFGPREVHLMALGLPLESL